MEQYFEEQIKRETPLTDDIIDALVQKTDDSGRELQAGDIQLYYYVEKEVSSNSTGTNINLSLYWIIDCRLSELSEKGYSFVRYVAGDNKIPVFKLNE